MAPKSKAYRAAVDKLEPGKFYGLDEAVALVKETGSKKFDSTVEVALKLGVDPRKADQMVRSTVILPHGTGKTARVIVFATGPAAEAAIAAGADEVVRSKPSSSKGRYITKGTVSTTFGPGIPLDVNVL